MLEGRAYGRGRVSWGVFGVGNGRGGRVVVGRGVGKGRF